MSPDALGAERVGWLFWTLIIEFLVVHSTGFMAAAAYSAADRPARLRSAAMFGFPYLVLTGIFAIALRAWWPFTSFWSLTANRWLGPLIGRAAPKETQRFVIVSWIVSLTLYSLVIPAAMVVAVPELGLAGRGIIPAGMQQSAGDPQLHRWMAAGGCYFVLNGLSEAVRHRWIPARWQWAILRTTELRHR